jgi:hypothetical protein
MVDVCLNFVVGGTGVPIRVHVRLDSLKHQSFVDLLSPGQALQLEVAYGLHQTR